MHEGDNTRNTLKGTGKAMGDVANILGLTRQGLNYHLRKPVLEDGFKKLLRGKFPYVFNFESEMPMIVKEPSNGYAIGQMQHSDGESPFIDLGNGQYIMIVPLVQDYAYAGYLSGFQDDEYLEELPKHSFVVNKQHKGHYMAFQVIGDSMSNGTDESITEGSTVTGREIQRHLWNSRFHIHRFKDYVIIHKEGILIKRIIKHDVDAGIITCQSLNPDREWYPDFELNLDDCSQIFNIVNVTQIR